MRRGLQGIIAGASGRASQWQTESLATTLLAAVKLLEFESVD